MRFRQSSVCLLFLISTPLALHAQTPAPVIATTVSPAAPAYLSDPKFQSAMKEGKQFERQHKMDYAIEAYKKANKIAGGQCAECLKGLYTAQVAMGSYKDAVATTNGMEALATTPSGKATAEYYRGSALLAQAGEKPKPAQLEAAHAAFQQAIANSPKAGAAYYLDGQTLAKMGKMEEAKADFLQCVSCASPNDPARLRAQHFAENPLLSTKKMAPAFVVTALDGSKFNLDAMGGHVVLIDFWATWCGPCKAELPRVKKMYADYHDRGLEILSVSNDYSSSDLTDFTAKNEMPWPELYDDAAGSNHHWNPITLGYGIHGIPTMFLIDKKGICRTVEARAKMEDLIPTLLAE
jgi:thiol-disulfide isomerase/thioredoxin